MGAGASFSIPIRVAGRLWGLVACHHLGARLLPPDCRTVCESLINAYSLGLTSHLASRRFQMLDSLERRIGKILEALAEHDDPLDGIARMADLLKDTMDAQAFAMAAGDDVVIAGDGPDLDAMGVIDDWFLNESSDTVAFTDHLADIFPDQPMLLAAVSGMAAVKARSANSGWVCFYWFRPAQPQEVAWAGNPDKPVVENTNLAVLFIDLDNFKVINDSLGHDVGDQLLKQATERLRSCVRDCDTLARLGGDEFVVVLMDVELKKINSLAGRIVDFIGGSFNIGGKSLFVSASIGISVFPGDGEDSVSLLKHADTAMYRAKERGRNQYQFFAEEMKVVALQRLTLETGLRLAIEMGTLRLCYQPQVDIRTGAVVGAEALLRWHDPNLGDVSPVQFIPIAESCGLIGAVGEVVFALALKQIAEWRRSGLTVPRIAINVSAHQLRAPGFVDKVAGWLTENGLNADAIGIELTESALMERIDMVKDMLVRFDHMGVKISIDDFGTGYSSLSYLKKLPIHELKIDRSFVDGIASDRDDRSITIAIIDMSRALGMRVVAEGVETEDQLGVLTEEGCDMIQGYLFHRPLSPEAFAEVLRTGGKKELAKAGGMAAFR
jgi:diguanylate cyclase (GGDEF)-like protein